MGEIIKLSKKLGEIETGGVVLPDGVYGFKILKVTKEKGPTDAYLKVQIQVEVAPSDSFVGLRPFPDQLSLSKQAEWKLGLLLKAVGMPEDKDQFNTDSLVGKKYVALATTETYEGVPRNKYASYMPLDEKVAAEIKAGTANITGDSGNGGRNAEVKNPADW